MPLSASFNRLSYEGYRAKIAPKRRRESPPPFSLRLTADERSRLEADAGGAPLGSYIKAKLLTPAPSRARRSGLTIADRRALGQLLAALGRSEIAANLALLAEAARIGSLDATPDVALGLSRALKVVGDMRRMLMVALGLKPDGAP